nr:hypothetical protein CFP56_57232 [Quercus suber]
MLGKRTSDFMLGSINRHNMFCSVSNICLRSFVCRPSKKEDSRAGGWSSFGKKIGGELGHDNVLAAFND